MKGNEEQERHQIIEFLFLLKSIPEKRRESIMTWSALISVDDREEEDDGASSARRYDEIETIGE